MKRSLVAICAVILVATLGVAAYAAKLVWLYFPESSFTLSPESRLPRWISSAPQHRRTDEKLTMDYHTPVVGINDIEFKLRDAKGHITEHVWGKALCQLTPIASYPDYKVVTVNGLLEIIEHKQMEPIFSVTDDPMLWAHYKAGDCK